MKKFKIVLISLVSVLGIFALGACGKGEEAKKEDKNEKLQVVATNSILADMTEQVGKDKVDIHSIVPRGTDPHEFEPLPEDIAKATDADVIFYNGLNLETGGDGWFMKLMKTSKKEENKDYFVTSKDVKPMYLTSKGQESEQDPHAWLSLENGIKYVENIKDVLVEKDEKNKDFYEKNAESYISELEKLHKDNVERYKEIPKDKNLLVTSEGAFKYFSDAYGIQAAYIWEINTESQGTPEQMSQIIDKIKKSNVSSLFVEQSVDPRSMESVSRETKLPIYDTIFTDSLAKEGEKGDTYLTMMTWNLDKIHDGLMK
ncbi:metal ABC transporter substrate-binding protein [Vagococcus carniphilus]|uniref:Metal ABC transporter substrate-binding protein n=1 Tax=Vagococcus carniphilus TaxID=218144 RepID=A0AAW8U3Q8_9ENTE|nr:metal ABC transporter substrate-binding protein [Vagococcus carniphilus]MDT2814113.1 metal ABC transporter substrate-binding protein [Vagococcus carniphilus]MDT2830324.1 metal ABC transporter substrate-binding protein [Vagococcus carniphilus]MDT2834245.1 metal ABC transporter substrate-binding protein [Vagococcus carniphilus]MDT2847904.1 metal ABC transporter substrate-binding protein [Vagococcus carniphilus]MDT2854598.1 metal ABC transporter substrate-binding protein [Vagococcus carniphilu